VRSSRVHLGEPRRFAGTLELERANIRWFLSIDPNDLPFPSLPGTRTTFRSITVDGSEIEFSDGFGDLHTRVYEKTLAGRGFRIADARPSIELVHLIRTGATIRLDDDAHPLVKRMKGSA
jgi:UDP-N-acetyl-2-amino-2-deoxyglucuronate dehydrogenase